MAAPISILPKLNVQPGTLNQQPYLIVLNPVPCKQQEPKREEQHLQKPKQPTPTQKPEKQKCGVKRKMQNPEFKPLIQGSPLPSIAKQIILNVFIKTQVIWPKKTTTEITRITSQLTGVSENSVYRARAELEKNGKLSTPSKKRPNAHRARRTDRFTEIDLYGIRAKIHDFYRINKIPNLKQILNAVNDDPKLPDFSRSTLHKLLRDIGFNFKNTKNGTCFEKDEIVAWRHSYLRDVRDYRKNGRKFYFLDEARISESVMLDNVWIDSNDRKLTSKNDERLIIGHIGSDTGFVDDGLLLFRSKKQHGDHHGKFFGTIFNEWMEKIFPKLEPDSVIVLSTSPNHNYSLECVPTIDSTKSEIQRWLKEKSIYFPSCMLKTELLKVVESVEHRFKSCQVDIRAKEFKLKILRIPPHHCNLNPMELVWSQVKKNVCTENRIFGLAQIEEMLIDEIERVTASDWENFVKSVVEEEQNMWKLDCLVDKLHDINSLAHEDEDNAAYSCDDDDLIDDSDDDQ